MDGFIPTLRVEHDATTLNVVTPPVRPLGRNEGDAESVRLGLFTVGRSLARLHSSVRLSHNNVCATSIFVSERSGAWLLSDELASDMKGTFIDLLQRVTPMLDPTTLPLEFQGSSTQLATATYPIHARDSFSYAKLLSDFAARLHLPISTNTRSILESMSDRDFSKRPTLDNILKSDFFANNLAIKVVGQLIDLRNGSLSTEAATQLFTELPSHLATFSKNKAVLGMVIDNLTKFSVVVHPAATATKFLQSFFTVKSENNLAASASAESVVGLLELEDFRKLVLPFLGELWTMERPGIISILLKNVGKYIYRLNPDFVSVVVVKRIVSLNILLEPGVPQLYLQALPVILKALLKKGKDAAPIVRHLVQQVPLFSSNDIALRTKALTCLLVHPKIPNLLIKEYLARGLTDPTPQVRLNVIAAVKKFGLQFADNSGPMSAKCLADAVIGSLLLSMVDKDAKVREKARTTIRKLTYVMERKDAEIEASYAAQHSSNPASPQAVTITNTSQQQRASAVRSPSTPSTTSALSQPLSPGPSMMDDWDNDSFDEDPEETPKSVSKSTSTPKAPTSTASSASVTPSSSQAKSLSSVSAQKTKDLSDSDLFSSSAKAAAPSTPKPAKATGSSWGNSWDAWGDEAAEDENDGLVGAPDTPLSRSKASFVATWEENDDFAAESPRNSARTATASIARQPSTTSLGKISVTSSSKSLSISPSASKSSVDPASSAPSVEQIEEIKVTRIPSPVPAVSTPSKSFEINSFEEDALGAWGDDDDFDEGFVDATPISTTSKPATDSLPVPEPADTLQEPLEPVSSTSPEPKLEAEPQVASGETYLIDSSSVESVKDEIEAPQKESDSSSTIEKLPSHFTPTDSLEANEEDLGDWGEDF